MPTALVSINRRMNLHTDIGGLQISLRSYHSSLYEELLLRIALRLILVFILRILGIGELFVLHLVEPGLNNLDKLIH